MISLVDCPYSNIRIYFFIIFGNYNSDCQYTYKLSFVKHSNTIVYNRKTKERIVGKWQLDHN